MRLLILFLLLLSTVSHATHFSHLVGVSYLYDNPSSSQLHPSGYGLRYQLGLNDKWFVNANYSKSSDLKESETKPKFKDEYDSEFINLGLSYQQDNYYIDMQLYQFDDSSLNVSRKPIQGTQSDSSGYGLGLGIGRYYEVEDFTLEYGINISGSQSDITQKQRQVIDDVISSLDIQSTLQQASATIGTNLSYFKAFEDWAIIPQIGVSWTQLIGENEDHDKLVIRQGEQRFNLLRRGIRYPGLLAIENSGVIDIAFDISHYQGLSFSLMYSVGFATEYQVNAWMLETSYAF